MQHFVAVLADKMLYKGKCRTHMCMQQYKHWKMQKQQQQQQDTSSPMASCQMVPLSSAAKAVAASSACRAAC
jgi:hypothetical protein